MMGLGHTNLHLVLILYYIRLLRIFKDWVEGETFAKSEPHQKAMKEVPPGGVARFVVGGHFFPIMV